MLFYNIFCTKTQHVFTLYIPSPHLIKFVLHSLSQTIIMHRLS